MLQKRHSTKGKARMLTVLQVENTHRYLGKANPTLIHKTLQEPLSKGKARMKCGKEENGGVRVSPETENDLGRPRKKGAKVTSGHLAATMASFPSAGASSSPSPALFLLCQGNEMVHKG